MTFSLGQLALLGVGYLFSLFLAAYAVERNWLPRAWVPNTVMASSPTTWVFPGPLSCPRFC